MKDNYFTLSEQSKTFIENLRLYLFSSGKNSDEIEEIVWDLEQHLYEAEKKGKPIEKVVGNSPEEYMKMISNEMEFDYRAWFKYFILIVVGASSISILGKVFNNSLSYSLLEIVGFIAVAALFIFLELKGFKYISVTKDPTWKQLVKLFSIQVVPILLFIGLILLNKTVETPIIYFDKTGTIIIGIVTALFIIGMSFWAKTWLLIVVVAFTTLPGYFLKLTALTVETQLILELIIMFGGIGIYLFTVNFVEKKKEKFVG